MPRLHLADGRSRVVVCFRSSVCGCAARVFSRGLAAGALLLASVAVAQVTAIRRLLPLPPHGRYAAQTPAQAAENLRNHGAYLQGSVEELARYIKSDPALDPEARRTVDDIVTWCQEEKLRIDEAAARIADREPGGDAKAGPPAAPAEKHEGFMQQATKTIPAEPRFE